VPTSDAPVKIWLAALRPRTLPAAVAPVVVGSALAWRLGRFHWPVAGICLAFALLVQIGANFANDYYDFVRGADTAERVGPRRAVAAGLVAPTTMRLVTWCTLGLALAVGLLLVAWGGWWLVAVGLACVASAVAYTGGPFPLGYHGLGDVFVFVFFGLVAVCVTFYVHTGMVGIDALLAATAMGALTVNILLVNNYRDADTDGKAGKKTLVVRFGKRVARWQFAVAHGVAAVTPLVLAWRGLFRPEAGALLLLPLVWIGYRQVATLRTAAGPAELIALLGRCGRYLAGYALMLGALLVSGR
jgi:1,4-dihydroxy-2-naphthoate octaprenyltransferase